MKKIILLVISLVFVASAFAGASGEAYMNYPLVGYADSADEDGGLVSGYVGVGYWGADYGFHFNFDNTAGGDYIDENGVLIKNSWTINHMFKKFTLHKYVNLLVGKTAIPFVKQNNPSGFANINIIEGACWGYVNPMNEFMLKFDGNVAGLGWQLYTANINASEIGEYYYADNGLRLDYTVAGAELGFGLMMVGVPEDADGMMNWAFDIGYTIAEMIDIDVQLVNYDDADDDTSDMNYYFVANYIPGFKGMVPYFGMLTYAEMEENEMFFGLNMSPTKDSILKLEYKMYSVENLITNADGDENDLYTDTLTLQLGFQF
jgi:hypothetical protein